VLMCLQENARKTLVPVCDVNVGDVAEEYGMQRTDLAAGG